MSERSTVRLIVLQVLVLSLVATLVGRLFYLQFVVGDVYSQQASDNRIREVITPAVRGKILDSAGRPLVSNRNSLVVSIDRYALLEQDDEGEAVLAKLATVLGTTPKMLADKITLCGTDGAIAGVCWNGSPYQPIPVAQNVDQDIAVTVMERTRDFPGVVAQLETIREYPHVYGVNAAHLLGYLGPVNDEELAAQETELKPGEVELQRTDLIGRAGLEAIYDQALRGEAGVRRLTVDRATRVTGEAGETDPTPGNYLVTNIDARLQSVTEQILADTVDNTYDPELKAGADGGAAVVLDVKTGHVLAMASYPTYSPAIWVGGITEKDYTRLTSEKNGLPLYSRSVQGLYPPASTFKAIDTMAAARENFDLQGTYDCPDKYFVGKESFGNFEGTGYGRISLAKAIAVSCNTVFYEIADKMWKQGGGLDAGPDAPDPIAEAARESLYGQQTGIDLPSESSGTISSRKRNVLVWQDRKDDYCKRAQTGYPEEKDPTFAQELKDSAIDFCKTGYQWKEGDALNAVVGQGNTLVTPLQVASLYAAIGNEGRIMTPQVAKAVMSPTGKTVKRFSPVQRGTLPADAATLTFLQGALKRVITEGTGKTAFEDFPIGRIPVAGKSGSAQVSKERNAAGIPVEVPSTAWFASYAPADDPQYAVVVMINKGGGGGATSAPAVKRIYDQIFGVEYDKDGKASVDPTRSVLYAGANPKLPKVRTDGTVAYPEEAAPPTDKAAAFEASRTPVGGTGTGPGTGQGTGGTISTGGAGDGATPAATPTGSPGAGATPTGDVSNGAALIALPLFLMGLAGNRTRRRRRRVRSGPPPSGRGLP